jgi:hypothetical protein
MAVSTHFPEIRWIQTMAGTYPWPVAMINTGHSVIWRAYSKGQNGGPDIGEGIAVDLDHAIKSAKEAIRTYVKGESKHGPVCQTCCGGGCYYCDS